MNIKPTTYKNALLESNIANIIFDRSSGESFRLEELFYPLNLDEGQYAFRNYEEQMEFARHYHTDDSNLFLTDMIWNASQSHYLLQKIDRLSDIQSTSSDYVPSHHNENKKIPSSGNPPFVPSPLAYNHTVPPSELQEDSLDKMETYYQNIIPAAPNDMLHIENTDNISSVKLLEHEPLYSHSSLIIPPKEIDEENDNTYSRILVIASAGHGKTTLLKRIALYYCHPFINETEHKNIRKKYALSGDYIPCLIHLRSITDNNFSVEKLITDSIFTILKNTPSVSSSDDTSLINSIRHWINSPKTRHQFLLLIDGLDELSDNIRVQFLSSLNNYLSEYPLTPVIMTSRVAGLLDDSVQSQLNKMFFRGRSIIPLTDDDARKYAEKWIELTQPPEQHIQLKSDFSQILTQNRFREIKALIRTPLDLILILKSSSSLNFFMLFHDNLWEKFTNHVKKFSQKYPVFEDTMTLLGFIAYQMQLKDSLLLSRHELEQLVGKLNHLSFHTDLTKNGTLDDYINILDSLAANVGIIERDDRSSEFAYTFPIRSYQEFLTAHACCHLRLNPQYSKPTPFAIFQQHLGDSQWIRIINFALSDLDTNSPQEFNDIVSLIFKETTNLELLRVITDADLAITKNHALLLCANVFSSPTLSREQKDLLLACMATKSDYAYAYALDCSYYNAKDNNSFLEAAALATVTWEYNTGRSACQKALACLTNPQNPKNARLGGKMITVMAKILLGETADMYKNKVSKDLVISNELLMALLKNALEQQEISCITALTNILLTRIDQSKKIEYLLDADLAQQVIAELNNYIPTVEDLCLVDNMEFFDTPEYREIQELIFTLGAFPVSASIKGILNHNPHNLFMSGFLQAFFQLSKDNMQTDRVALATVCLYYCWNINQFMDAWMFDICRGMPSQYVRKDMCCIRERNHFILKRDSLELLEQTYNTIHQQDRGNHFQFLELLEQNFHNTHYKDTANRLHKPEGLFDLFREGKLTDAANYCIRTIHQDSSSNNINLAFLIRYGHLQNTDLDSEQDYDIPTLLADGVSQNNSYALINLALYRLEQKQYSSAKLLLLQITADGWHDITKNLWYPELWDRTADPEGALVCVLAHQYAKCSFEEYNTMLAVVHQHYGNTINELLTP